MKEAPKVVNLDALTPEAREAYGKASMIDSEMEENPRGFAPSPSLGFKVDNNDLQKKPANASIRGVLWVTDYDKHFWPDDAVVMTVDEMNDPSIPASNTTIYGCTRAVVLYGNGIDAVRAVDLIRYKASDIRVGFMVVQDVELPSVLDWTFGRIWKKVDKRPGTTVAAISNVPEYNPCVIPTISTPYPYLDLLTGGLRAGELTVLCATRGCGKSTIAENISVWVADHGVKVMLYSGEVDPAVAVNQMMIMGAQDVGLIPAKIPEVGKDIVVVHPMVRERVMAKVGNNIMVCGGNISAEALIEHATAAVEDYGVRLVIVDNLMSLQGNTGAGYMDPQKYGSQASIVAALKDFSREANVHVLLLVHPRKYTGPAKVGLDMDDISGAAEISNLADTVCFLSRYAPPPPPKVTSKKKGDDGEGEAIPADPVWGMTPPNSILSVLKNRCDGSTGEIGLGYDAKSRVYYDWRVVLNGEKQRYLCQWDRTALAAKNGQYEAWTKYRTMDLPPYDPNPAPAQPVQTSMFDIDVNDNSQTPTQTPKSGEGKGWQF